MTGSAPLVDITCIGICVHQPSFNVFEGSHGSVSDVDGPERPVRVADRHCSVAIAPFAMALNQYCTNEYARDYQGPAAEAWVLLLLEPVQPHQAGMLIRELLGILRPQKVA